jgi:hypothetical protein
MRPLAVALLACANLALVSSIARAQAASQPPQKREQQFQAEDGGVSEVLESIVIPAKPQAPFTLTLETEWVKTLYDGGTITWVNKRRIARDSAGRIYQERWALVPKAGNAESMMTVIQISDPSAHTLYNCFIVVKKDTCELLTYVPMTLETRKAGTPATGPLHGDQGDVLHQDLGKQFLAGVETEGTRDATTYNPGTFGNDRKVTVEREFWYSPQLGINLLSIRSDPRIGKQTFTVTSVTLSEPDPKLFELPAGFKVVDHRQTAPPEPN